MQLPFNHFDDEVDEDPTAEDELSTADDNVTNEQVSNSSSRVDRVPP
jgi:hypothetical protein